MHLLSPAWIAKHLFALVILLMLIRLGFWQLARLEERRAANRMIVAAVAAPAVALRGNEPDLQSLVGRRVRIRGTFDTPQTMVLRNQARDQVDGVHLLTPLRITDSDQAVVVDRGWLPAPAPGTTDWSAYAVAGEVEIEGIVHPSQTHPNSAFAPMDLPMVGETRIAAWLRIDLELMQRQIPYPLLPISIEQLPDPLATAAAPAPQGTKLDEGPHLSYALQWFTFATLLVVVYTILIRQELKRHAKKATDQ